LRRPRVSSLDLKGDLVAIFQGGGTGVRKRRAVHEHVLLALVRRDEVEAACLVEEFYCAVDAHGASAFPWLSFERALWRLRPLGVLIFGKETCS